MKNVKTKFKKVIQENNRALSTEFSVINYMSLAEIVFDMRKFEIKKICVSKNEAKKYHSLLFKH